MTHAHFVDNDNLLNDKHRYKQEVEKLTAQTESDRVLLQELIRQKEELEREERDTTERVWKTRRAILDKKAEAETLEQQRTGVDRESAMLAEEVLRLRAEVGQCVCPSFDFRTEPLF